MNNNFFKTAYRFIADLMHSFYSTFYAGSSGWFLITVSAAICLYFASSTGNPLVIKAFNLIILPWQIAFFVWIGRTVFGFLRARWHRAKRQ